MGYDNILEWKDFFDELSEQIDKSKNNTLYNFKLSRFCVSIKEEYLQYS